MFAGLGRWIGAQSAILIAPSVSPSAPRLTVVLTPLVWITELLVSRTGLGRVGMRGAVAGDTSTGPGACGTVVAGRTNVLVVADVAEGLLARTRSPCVA